MQPLYIKSHKAIPIKFIYFLHRTNVEKEGLTPLFAKTIRLERYFVIHIAVGHHNHAWVRLQQ